MQQYAEGTSEGARQGQHQDQSARGLTGMSFSAWFSALGLPFFLPSVLSLVAFPANRHSARHPLSSQPCQRSCRAGNAAARLAPWLCVRRRIPFGRQSQLQLNPQMPTPETAASPEVCQPLSFHLHQAVSAQLGLLWKTILLFGLEEILQQLHYLAKEICV